MYRCKRMAKVESSQAKMCPREARKLILCLALTAGCGKRIDKQPLKDEESVQSKRLAKVKEAEYEAKKDHVLESTKELNYFIKIILERQDARGGYLPFEQQGIESQIVKLVAAFIEERHDLLIQGINEDTKLENLYPLMRKHGLAGKIYKQVDDNGKAFYGFRFCRVTEEKTLIPPNINLGGINLNEHVPIRVYNLQHRITPAKDDPALGFYIGYEKENEGKLGFAIIDYKRINRQINPEDQSEYSFFEWNEVGHELFDICCPSLLRNRYHPDKETFFPQGKKDHYSTKHVEETASDYFSVCHSEGNLAFSLFYYFNITEFHEPYDLTREILSEAILSFL